MIGVLFVAFMGKLISLRRSTNDELSDEALLRACSGGDPKALGLLYDRFHTAVYRFLARYLGGQREDLDDLVQSTFLTVLRSAASYQGRSSARTWVLGIALNQARHHVRGSLRRRLSLLRVAEQPAPRAVGPEERADQQQQLERLQQALGELPTDLRAAFILCDLEDIPGVEAAQILGVPAGTLWRRLHDARKRLRAAIGGAP